MSAASHQFRCSQLEDRFCKAEHEKEVNREQQSAIFHSVRTWLLSLSTCLHADWNLKLTLESVHFNRMLTLVVTVELMRVSTNDDDFGASRYDAATRDRFAWHDAAFEEGEPIE